jgi:hypothetical protein
LRREYPATLLFSISVESQATLWDISKETLLDLRDLLSPRERLLYAHQKRPRFFVPMKLPKCLAILRGDELDGIFRDRLDMLYFFLENSDRQGNLAIFIVELC